MKPVLALNPNKNVYFNRGQRLSPEDLNSLSDFAASRDALLTKTILGKAGVIRGLGRNFDLSLSESDSYNLTVSSGLGVNHCGEIISLDEPQAISLQSFSGLHAEVVYIQLIPETTLQEPFCDEECEDIKGFRFRMRKAVLKASTELHPEAVEVARFIAPKNHPPFTLQTNSESLDLHPGVIDSRMAPAVYITSSFSLSPEEHYKQRSVAKTFRFLMESLRPLFPTAQEVDRVIEIARHLHADVQEPIMAPYKVAHWFNELRSSLLEMVRALRPLVNAEDSSADAWDDLQRTIDDLDCADRIASTYDFLTLATLSNILREHILRIRGHEEQRLIVSEAIRDMRETKIDFHQTLPFAGSLYERVSGTDAQKIESEAKIQSDFHTLMTVNTKFEDGAHTKARALFVSRGELSVELEGLKPGVDTVVMWQVLKRRGALCTRSYFNGRELHRSDLAPNQYVDRALNEGFCLAGDQVSEGQNTVSFKIDEADMEFALAGIWVYQARRKP